MEGIRLVERKLYLMSWILLLTSMFTLTFHSSSVEGGSKVVLVPSDFLTIQGAINAAGEGDTIKVMRGTYHEHVTVNKSVSLIGENRSTTVIDGDGVGNVVFVTADNVIVEGFTVKNGSSGIYVVGVYNCTVDGNFVDGNKNRGILISKSQDCAVSNNYVSGTQSGYSINVNASQNVLVKDNAATYNYFDGVGLFSSNDSIVTGNTVSYNSLFGIVVDYYSHNNIVYHNNFFRNGIQAASSNPSNIWDNGVEGNYWGDYDGEDVDGNGVGDSAYVVDKTAEQNDRFPLFHPYVNEVYVRVDVEPPVALFNYSSESIFVNQSVSFNASESYDSVGNHAILEYNWDFGDGNRGFGIIINHSYAYSGNFTVVLKVVDAAGHEATASVDIHVQSLGNGFPILTVSIGVIVGLTVVALAVGFLRKKKISPFS